jgi:hypothetical protein
MHLSKSDEHDTPCVVIEPDEDPDLQTLYQFAADNEAMLWTGAYDNIVVDDQSSSDRQAGPRLYNVDTLEEKQDSGCTTWRAANIPAE